MVSLKAIIPYPIIFVAKHIGLKLRRVEQENQQHIFSSPTKSLLNIQE
jgi:hypothetical protein